MLCPLSYRRRRKRDSTNDPCRDLGGFRLGCPGPMLSPRASDQKS